MSEPSKQQIASLLTLLTYLKRRDPLPGEVETLQVLCRGEGISWEELEPAWMAEAKAPGFFDAGNVIERIKARRKSLWGTARAMGLIPLDWPATKALPGEAIRTVEDRWNRVHSAQVQAQLEDFKSAAGAIDGRVLKALPTLKTVDGA